MSRRPASDQLEAYRLQQVEIARKIKEAEEKKRARAKADELRRRLVLGAAALDYFSRPEQQANPGELPQGDAGGAQAERQGPRFVQGNAGVTDREREPSVNPPHNHVRHPSPEVIKAQALTYHRKAGTMETYYELYPADRPPGRDPRDGGRGR